MKTIKAVGVKGGAAALLLTGVMSVVPIFAEAAHAATGASGTTAGVIGTAGATGAKGLLGPNPHFLAQQQKLEQNTAIRQAQLAKLTAFVDGTNSLSAADKTLLSSRLAAETTSVNQVAIQVPTDTTPAELLADATTLYHDNRVFAVMTPQVNLTNRADAELAKMATLRGEITASAPASISTELNTVAANITASETVELGQIPQDWPSNEPVFTQSRAALTQAAAQLKTIAQELRQESHVKRTGASGASGVSGTVGASGSVGVTTSIKSPKADRR